MDGRSTRLERGCTLGFIEGLVARRIGKRRAGVNRREEESGAGEEGELAVREWQRTAHPPQCPVYCMARPVSKMHGGACDSRATVRVPRAVRRPDGASPCGPAVAAKDGRPVLQTSVRQGVSLPAMQTHGHLARRHRECIDLLDRLGRAGEFDAETLEDGGEYQPNLNCREVAPGADAGPRAEL